MSASGVFPRGAARGNLITKRGYLKIAKTLGDDKAWEVFDEMIERYFAVEAAPQQIAIPTTAEAFANSFQMLAKTERTQTAQVKALAHLSTLFKAAKVGKTVRGQHYQK